MMRFPKRGRRADRARDEARWHWLATEGRDGRWEPDGGQSRAPARDHAGEMAHLRSMTKGI